MMKLRTFCPSSGCLFRRIFFIEEMVRLLVGGFGGAEKQEEEEVALSWMDGMLIVASTSFDRNPCDEKAKQKRLFCFVSSSLQLRTGFA